MNEKETLILLIKQKGSCHEPIYIKCGDCILDNHCNHYCDSNINKYKLAVEMFVKLYGEENLMEVLL